MVAGPRAGGAEAAMLTTTWFDHLLAGSIVFVDPVIGAWWLSRVARRIASGDSGARARLYRRTIAEQWAWTLGLLIGWAWLDRPFAWLGLGAPSGASAWITAVLCTAAVALFGTQIYAVLVSADARASMRADLDRSGPGVQTVIPGTAKELRLFLGVSLTAGFCEEVLARGFMLWYFNTWLPSWAAIAVVIVAFGVGHAYQGPRGVLLTAAAGSIYLAAYLATGSLVAPIVMHAATDLANGFMAYRARRPGGVLTAA